MSSKARCYITDCFELVGADIASSQTQSTTGSINYKSHQCLQFNFMGKTQHSGDSKEVHQQPQIEQPDKCVICMDQPTDKTLIKKCKHSFCYTCIEQWIQREKTTCPLCRLKFASILKPIKPIEIPDQRRKRNLKNKVRKIRYELIKIKNIPRLAKPVRRNTTNRINLYSVAFMPYYPIMPTFSFCYGSSMFNPIAFYPALNYLP